MERDILPFIEPVHVTNVPNIVEEDPQDNIYLACAEQGQADFLVSSDKHILKLQCYKKVVIVPPAGFLKLLGKRHRAISDEDITKVG